MVAALRARARGRGRERHFNLQLFEGIAKALPRQGPI
jgi:hypothetical protein